VIVNSEPAISIATSLMPRHAVELQMAALTSWQDCGFKVTSVNTAAEILELRKYFRGIDFHEAPRTAEKIVGKPVPFIRDVLLSARAREGSSPVIGLINSDIFIRPIDGLASALCHHAREAMVLLPRVDVANADVVRNFHPNANEKLSTGYDGVFMPAAMLDDIPDSLFCIGMPFWDYWLPLIAILKGHPLKTLVTPIALHVSHETRWDGSVYLFFHALMSDLLKTANAMKPSAAASAFDVVVDALSHVYGDIFERGTKAAQSPQAAEALAALYDRLQEVIVHHIKTKAQPVYIPAAGQAA
jgi:hypothetical protein